jgi:hypothetical protein
MPYQITLPDGSIGMIDDSVPKDRAMEAAEAAYPDAFPGIGEQLLGAPAEFAKGFARGLVDPVSGGVIRRIHRASCRRCGDGPLCRDRRWKRSCFCFRSHWLPVTEPPLSLLEAWVDLSFPRSRDINGKRSCTSRNPWRYGYRTGRRRGQRPS